MKFEPGWKEPTRIYSPQNNEGKLSVLSEIFARGQKCATAQQCISSMTLNSDMTSLLGSVTAWDRLIANYCDHFEHNYRILHNPTFYRTFENFKKCPEGCRVSTFTKFIPQLLLVLLIGSSLDESESFVHEIAAESPSPQCIIDIVEAWLEKQPRKARNELSFLRAQCLLLLAQQIHQAPKERLWTLSGCLVRSAILMGLHHDPSQFRSISVFQGEMRRKLWVTVVELDLQMSMHCGAPAMVRSGDGIISIMSFYRLKV